MVDVINPPMTAMDIGARKLARSAHPSRRDEAAHQGRAGEP
jgi:hypothetical protein